MSIDPVGVLTSSQLSQPPIHLFLSFRGTDTREDFVPFLYNALIHAGFNVFMDDESIRMGQNIDSKIHDAIARSMGAAIIFSGDFASSRWCLNEVDLIRGRMAMVGSDHYVLAPIYIGVDPNEVRYQTGRYGSALAKRNKWYSYWIWDSEEVKVWRAALKDIAGYRGRLLKGSWPEFIDVIVEDIRQEFRDQYGITVNPPCCPYHRTRMDRLHAVHKLVLIGNLIFLLNVFLNSSFFKQQYAQFMQLLATIINTNIVVEIGSSGICNWEWASAVLVLVVSTILTMFLAFRKGIPETSVPKRMAPEATVTETMAPEAPMVSTEVASWNRIKESVRGSFAAIMPQLP